MPSLPAHGALALTPCHHARRPGRSFDRFVCLPQLPQHESLVDLTPHHLLTELELWPLTIPLDDLVVDLDCLVRLFHLPTRVDYKIRCRTFGTAPCPLSAIV